MSTKVRLRAPTYSNREPRAVVRQAMRKASVLAVAVFLAAPPASTQPAPTASIVVFHANDFWLNLHQFLYVLGRHEAAIPDRMRRATAGAPADEERGFAVLSEGERASWRKAVGQYAAGPSRQDAVFDARLIAVGGALARAADASSLPRAGLDAEIAAVLEAAAPIYRKGWWDAHRRANEEWASAMTALVERHGRTVHAYITRAYGLPWPSAGYPVRVSSYANWAGAFSTDGNLLIVSSLDPGNRGLTGLEITFHETMHQWDEAIDRALDAEAKRLNRSAPGALSHAMIFYTAGEAVRSVVPDHVTYAEANGMWRQRGMGAFKPVLDEVWKPYLSGSGTRDEALAAMIERLK